MCLGRQMVRRRSHKVKHRERADPCPIERYAIGSGPHQCSYAGERQGDCLVQMACMTEVTENGFESCRLIVQKIHADTGHVSRGEEEKYASHAEVEGSKQAEVDQRGRLTEM